MQDLEQRLNPIGGVVSRLKQCYRLHLLMAYGQSSDLPDLLSTSDSSFGLCAGVGANVETGWQTQASAESAVETVLTELADELLRPLSWAQRHPSTHLCTCSCAGFGANAKEGWWA